MVSQSGNGSKGAGYDKILEVAEELFARRGYEGVTIQEIADQAGISKSLILYHFKDKKNLFKSIVDKSVGLVFKELGRSLKGTGSPSEKISIFIASYFQLVFKEENLVQILFREWSSPDSPLAKYIIKKCGDIVEMLAVILNQGMRDGSFRVLDPRIAAVTLFGMLNTYVAARAVLGPEATPDNEDLFDLPHLTEEITMLFSKGVNKC